MDERIAITNILLHQVRHLREIEIPVCQSADGEIKHLLLTGKNGSGKTSVLEALSHYLGSICQNKDFFSYLDSLKEAKKNLQTAINHGTDPDEIKRFRDKIALIENRIAVTRSGISLELNCDARTLYDRYQDGEFILAFFKDNRIFDAIEPKHVEKVALKKQYSIQEEPGHDFIKYLVDKKVSQSLYLTRNDRETAMRLQQWFDSFEGILKEIFEDPALVLDFDVETFRFSIVGTNRERFDFNTMSAGYAAIVDIAVGIIMRMEAHTGGSFKFDMPGIVLIDELETHLHYGLQKKILPFLCRIFPRVQFIVTTHSAFILNSMENVVIYDLENRKLVENGLADVPYDGIIRGYFEASTLSDELQRKFDSYKRLTKKETLSDDDLAEISRLELYLDEIPDYLALPIATEYQQLKIDFENREDL